MSRKVEMYRNIIVVLLAVSILAMGCNTSREIEVDASDKGRQIELEQNQILVITLPFNPGTGYRWEVAETEASILRQLGEAVFEVSDLGEPPPPGKGGAETCCFEATDAGQMTLELVYHRPWEEDVDPLETFSIQVVVH